MNGLTLGPNIVILHRHKRTGEYNIEGARTFSADNLVKNYNAYNTKHPIDLARGERKTAMVHYRPGTPLQITSLGI